MRTNYFLSILIVVVGLSTSMAQVPGEKLFDNSKIHEIKIVSLRDNLPDTLEANYVLSYGINQIQIREIPYTSIRLIVDGTELDTVAIRYKGFNSWWHSVKKPIKIDLNKYKSGQSYDGLKKFNLHNGSGDPSFIRENINYQILRLLGLKAPRTSYAKVFMDTTYLGLYRLVEQVDNTFLDVNFGDHTGNLYKQQSKSTAGFSLTWRGSNQEDYYSSISLENHENKNDWSDLVHFIDILNNTTDDRFRDAVLSVFDVDEFLLILAFDVTVNNLDFYGNSGRNYYLYNDNGLFHWISWDYNLTWQADAKPVNLNPSDYPVLIRRILEVPEFYETFMEKCCQVKTYFSAGFISQMLRNEVTLISSNLQNDPFPDYPFEAFQKNIDSDWMRIPGLIPFAANRYADISTVLESLNIDCRITGNVPSHRQNGLTLYPIPAKDYVTIGFFPDQEFQVNIYSHRGQLIRSEQLFESGKLNLSGLTSGCYIVKVKTANLICSKLLFVVH